MASVYLLVLIMKEIINNKLNIDDIENKKNAYYLRNFITFCIEGFLFSGASSLFSSETVLPVYVSKISNDPFSIALISIIYFGLSYGSYFFSCTIGVNTKSPKWTTVYICFLQRIGFFMIYLSTFAILGNSLNSLFIFYISLSFLAISAGLSNPLFSQMVSVSIFKNVSSFYGVYSLFGAAGGVLGTIIYNRFLKNYTFPFDYRYTFLCGVILAVVATIVVMIGIREVVDDRVVEKIKLNDVFHIAKDILKNNRNFRNFTILRVLMVAADFSVPYYILMVLNKPKVPVGYEGTLAIIFLISKMIASYFEGKIGDKYNPYVTLIVCTCCGVIASLLAIISNSWQLSTIMYIFVAFAVSGAWIATSSAAITFSNNKYVPIYSSIISLFSAPVYIVISLSGAYIAKHLSYDAMFFVSLIVYLICSMLGFYYIKGIGDNRK